MPYFIIAFGLVLSCFGGLAMANGSSIIQVERGWSLFIGGSTLLSGGIVTMAIGVATKALIDRAAGLLAHQIGAERVESMPIAGLAPDSIASVAQNPGYVPAPVAPAFKPDSTPQIAERHDMALADVREPPDAAVIGDIAPAAEPDDVHFGAEPPSASVPPNREVAHEAHAAGETEVALDERSADPAPVTTRERLFRKGPPRSRPHAPAEDVLLPPPLDRAEPLDVEPLDAEPPYPPAPAEHASSAAEDETATVASPREPFLFAPPPTAPVSAPSVVGRYEADGTSYVMFSDGSIEAQSAAGVYRFASMAELKSFIET